MKLPPNPRQITYIKWFFSTIMGFIIALSYFIWLTALNPVGILYKVCIYLYLGLFFTIIVYFLVFRLSLPLLNNYSARWKIAWFIGSFFLGIWLVISLPITAPHSLTTVSLIITSTGQKNSQSNGSEVWVAGLYYNDGRLVSPDKYSMDNGWEIKNGVPFSPTADHPANLTWRGQVYGDMKLVITAHPWSGIAIINWDGNQQNVDLYDPVGKDINITLPVNIPAVSVWIKLLFLTSVGVGIGLLLFGLSSWFVTRARPILKLSNVSKKWKWLIYSLPIIIVWLVYLVSFWPGIITLDSAALWRQVLDSHFNDWQPAFLPMLMWMISRIWLSPALIAIFQILSLALISGYLFYRLERLGAPNIIVWIGIILMAFSPVNGTMVITLWKDIPYSIVLLAMTVFSLDLYLSRGQSIRKIFSILLISSLLLLLALFRHNGIAVSIAYIVFVLLLIRNNYRRWFIVTLILVIGFFGVRNILYTIVSVDNSPYKLMKIVNPIYFIGAHLKAQTDFSPSEKQLINNVLPLDSWTYNCYLVDSLIYNPNLNIEYANDHYADLLKLVLSASLRNPKAILDHMICSSAVIWRITPPTDSLPYYIQSINKNDNKYLYIDRNNGYKIPIYESSLFPKVTTNLYNFYFWTITGTPMLLFWRPALYLFILIIISFIFCFQQKDTTSFVIFMPAFAQSMIMLGISAAQYPRYQYGIYLIALTIWPILFTWKVKQ